MNERVHLVRLIHHQDVHRNAVAAGCAPPIEELVRGVVVLVVAYFEAIKTASRDEDRAISKCLYSWILSLRGQPDA